MTSATRSHIRRATSLIVLLSSASLLAACASPQPTTSYVDRKTRSKEYFAESEYGVKASPRVSRLRSGLARGGGRDQIGKPYMVRGKMYYPKEDKKYKKVGLASWYGDAFHGRLTANGEVYDMTHLTAAHPTMPLPSYARVTNVANGSSVIVRVNDRGPYAHGRLIDLSHKAATMLDYANVGTAKVKVEYIGRAPLDGNDDKYLMASYKPGKGMDPSDGLPTGVMIAMNGETPSDPAAGAAVPFPGALTDVADASDGQSEIATDAPVMTASAVAPGDPMLPDFGPIAPERPAFDPALQTQLAMAAMGYAEDGQGGNGALSALARTAMTSNDVAASWKRLNAASAAAPQAASDPFVLAATFSDRKSADDLAAKLGDLGKAAVESATDGSQTVYSVSLREDGRAGIDDLLAGAWTHGAPDAMVVRD